MTSGIDFQNLLGGALGSGRQIDPQIAQFLATIAQMQGGVPQTGALNDALHAEGIAHTHAGADGAGAAVGGKAANGGANNALAGLRGGAVNFAGLTGQGVAGAGAAGAGAVANFTPATGAQRKNGDDQGEIIGVGYNNAQLDKIMGTDVNGTIGGGNAARATNNGVLDNGALGATRFTNNERTDFNALSKYIDTNGDPDAAMSLRSVKNEGNKTVYTGYLDGTPEAIAASTQNGRVNGAELANQGNNTDGQSHWVKEMGDMPAGANGTVVSAHNTVLGETVPMDGGGFRTFLVADNGGDHNGKINGSVADANAKTADEARGRIEIRNETNSVSDVENNGQVQGGAASTTAYTENKAAGKIPGAATATPKAGEDGAVAAGGAAHNH